VVLGIVGAVEVRDIEVEATVEGARGGAAALGGQVSGSDYDSQAGGSAE